MIQKILLIICIAALIGVIALPDTRRLLLTGYLITRVTPYEQAVAGAPTILVLGDSTGYGTGARRGVESVAGRLGADFPQYTIVNNSVNGRTIHELQRVAEGVEGEYALILLQIGGNDILRERGVVEVEEELRNVVATLTPHTEHLVMLSTGNVGGATALSVAEARQYEAITRDYRVMFARVAFSTALTYIDLFAEPANDPFVKNPERYLALDGLHPSSAGYELWYQSLRPTMQDLLEE